MARARRPAPAPRPRRAHRRRQHPPHPSHHRQGGHAPGPLNPTGRTPGHHRAVLLATPGQNHCPSAGRSHWPLTTGEVRHDVEVRRSDQGEHGLHRTTAGRRYRRARRWLIRPARAATQRCAAPRQAFRCVDPALDRSRRRCAGIRWSTARPAGRRARRERQVARASTSRRGSPVVDQARSQETPPLRLLHPFADRHGGGRLDYPGNWDRAFAPFRHGRSRTSAQPSCERDHVGPC